ncbi:hypothetical protein GGR93_003997 [Sulfitobacter noctilucicola]|uniref:Uncharacterized protein n=1 Tax=Sulfitobacter noctilucicola TaxID=1342301 RepID=A0A7W6MC66_9RHOB|nr:hypothetical protein [Sulfitobacter noctilucicola]
MSVDTNGPLRSFVLFSSNDLFLDVDVTVGSDPITIS